MKCYSFNKIVLLCFLAVLSIGKVEAQTTVTVGSETSYNYNYNIPFCNYYKHSTTETIYTSEELGGACTISDIAYYVSSASPLSNTTVKIYMGYKSGSTFSSTSDYATPSELTLVYSGTRTLGSATGWENYTLSTPFKYNGTRNMVVVVTKSASSYTSSLKYRYTTSDSKCLYRQNDSSTSYADYSNTSNSFTLSSERPNTRFTISKAAVVDSGTCGSNLTWTLTDDGTMAIAGTGGMSGYSYNNNAPWYNYRTRINSLVFEDGVTSIGNEAFSGCSNLTTVTFPNDITYIGDNSFSGTGLTSVSIPGSVTYIGYNAFGCSSLQELFFEEGPEYLDMAVWNGEWLDSPFYNCSNLNEITINRNINVSAITSCGEEDHNYLFTSVTKLNIGKNATKDIIPCFNSFKNLSEFTVSTENPYFTCDNNVIYSKDNKILYWAPRNVTGIFSAPSGVESIYNAAFWGSKYSAITLPSTVKSVDRSAFCDCVNLTDLYCRMEHPALISGNEFWNGIYSNCTLHVPLGSMDVYKATTGWKEFSNIETIIPPIIETGSCGENVLWTLYEGGILLIEGNGNMFDYSEYEYKSFAYGYFKSIIISDDVKSIGNWAFANFDGLISVTIGSGVTSIGENAFNGCSNLSTLSFGGNVISIGAKAFYGCGNITSVALDNSLATIGNEAFRYCENLSSISIGNNLGTVGANAFADCAVTSVYISDFDAWCNIDFEDYTSSPFHSNFGGNLYLNDQLLTDIVIPNNLTEIKPSSFYCCTGIKSVTIPTSVKTIGDFAFWGCKTLDSVDIHCGVTSIGDHSFAACLGLTSVAIPNSVTTIGDWGFRVCI